MLIFTKFLTIENEIILSTQWHMFGNDVCPLRIFRKFFLFIIVVREFTLVHYRLKLRVFYRRPLKIACESRKGPTWPHAHKST